MPKWRAIPGCFGYAASRSGKILSIKTGIVRKSSPVRSASRPNDRHRRVSLFVGGRHKTFALHRLIARTFIGPPPTAKHQVNHKNGRADDNRARNLEWVTPKENGEHAARLRLVASGERHGTHTKPETRCFGSKHGRSKLTEADILEIRRRGANGESQAVLAAAFSVTQASVSMILTRRTWRHVA